MALPAGRAPAAGPVDDRARRDRGGLRVERDRAHGVGVGRGQRGARVGDGGAGDGDQVELVAEPVAGGVGGEIGLDGGQRSGVVGRAEDPEGEPAVFDAGVVRFWVMVGTSAGLVGCRAESNQL